MEIQVAVENGNDGRSIAWALDYPGCFVYGPDEFTVLHNLPEVYRNYAQWISSHTPDPWVKTGSLSLRLVEVWQCYSVNDRFEIRENGYEVNAWFRDDWRPLSAKEITRGKDLLSWSREDLMKVIHTLSAGQMELYAPGAERWTIHRILHHIANAEWWYLDRLELAPWEKSDLPEEPFKRLDFVRTHVIKVMDELSGSKKVCGKDGEFWSPRKLLRRLLYHERDHLDHLIQILTVSH